MYISGHVVNDNPVKELEALRTEGVSLLSSLGFRQIGFGLNCLNSLQ